MNVKRLLAMLLVLLMIASMASADTMSAEVILEVDEARYAELFGADFAQIFGVQGVEGIELAGLAAQLLNGVGLRLQMQDDAATLHLLMAGKRLYDLSVYTSDERVLYSSDLFPGYGLYIPSDLLEATTDLDTLVNVNELAKDAAEAFDMAIASMNLEVTKSYGNFAGDAYDGGTYCQTIQLDDSDIADFFKNIGTPRMREMLSLMLGDNGSFMNELDRLHDSVSEKNVYSYLLRLVYGQELEPVGLSLAVNREGLQVMTVSVGIGDDTLQQVRIVIGMGRDQDNLWYDHVITVDRAGLVTGHCVEFSGAKDADFAMAMMTTLSTLCERDWTLQITSLEEGHAWSFDMNVKQDGIPYVQSIEHTGQLSAVNGTFDTLTKMLIDDAELANLKVSFLPCDPIAPATDTMTLLDMTANDEATLAELDEVSNLLTQMLTMRLLLILPAEQLTEFSELFE